MLIPPGPEVGHDGTCDPEEIDPMMFVKAAVLTGEEGFDEMR